MKIKGLWIISLVVMLICVAGMAYNAIFHYPDWVIRVLGVTMLVSVALLSYSTVKKYLISKE